MKHTLKKACPLIILGMCFIVCFSLQISLAFQTKKFLPDAICFKYKDGIEIPYMQLEKVANTSGVSQKQSSITNGFVAYPTQMMLTNEDYGHIANLKYKYGNYFFMDEVSLKNRFVVISDTLALKLFKTDNVVGYRTYIENIPYTICGIYEENQNRLNQLASQIGDIVYVPLISDFQPKAVEQVITLSTAEIPRSAADTVRGSLNSYFYYDYPANYNSFQNIIMQLIRLTIFFCGLGLIAVLVSEGVRRFKQNKIVWFFCVVCAIIILLLIWFPLYIPASWLPKDNIFDFKFYKEQLFLLYQNKNTYTSFDPFWNYAFLSLPSCIVLGLFSIISFYVWLAKLMPYVRIGLELISVQSISLKKKIILKFNHS